MATWISEPPAVPGLYWVWMKGRDGPEPALIEEGIGIPGPRKLRVWFIGSEEDFYLTSPLVLEAMWGPRIEPPAS